MNRRTWFMLQFAVGLITSITAASLMFVYGTEGLGFNPVVLGIFGIGLIATSNIWLFPNRSSS